MIKFIVTWCLVTTYYGSPPPQTDEFGRTSMFSCAVAIAYHNTSCDHRNEFTDSVSAKQFYDRCLMQGDVTNAKIEKK